MWMLNKLENFQIRTAPYHSFLNYEYLSENDNILLLFFTVVILINFLNLVLKYVFNQNIFNFKDCLLVFDSSTIFFIFLSSGAEFLKEVLFSLSFVFYVIVLACFSFYVIMIFYGFKYYLNLNKEELKIFCLKIQRVIHENQTFIFSVTNGVLFLFLCQLFDPIKCFIIHILWLDVTGYFICVMY
jgi:hypothetical protein